MNTETRKTNELKDRIAVALAALEQAAQQLREAQAQLREAQALLNEPAEQEDVDFTAECITLAHEHQNEMIVLTKEMIEACRTEQGGFTKDTIRSLGVTGGPWNAVWNRGWLKALIGTEIRRLDYDIALIQRIKPVA